MRRPAALFAVGMIVALAPALAAAGDSTPPTAAPVVSSQPAPAPESLHLPPAPVEQPAQPAPKPAAAAPEDDDHEHAEGSPADAAKSSTLRTPEFFGDQAPIGSLLQLPSGQIEGRGAVFVPSARYFKISDNDSPQPRTRSYFSFNYFYNLNGPVNEALGGGIQHTRIHREIWGVEWADPDGSSSLGLRLPLNTFNAATTVPGLDGTSTDIGDLSIILKYVLWQDHHGTLVSGGLAITPPTGPGSFAGSNDIKVFHNTTLQPYCGWIWSRGKLYLQGFTAVDVPTDLNDVAMLSNDFAVGYFLYQNHSGSTLSAVVPTVEVHINTPLNHRGVLGLTDPAGNPDLIDLTAGIHFEHSDHSSMGIAFAVPVTGPRLFDFEILAQFRVRY